MRLTSAVASLVLFMVVVGGGCSSLGRSGGETAPEARLLTRNGVPAAVYTAQPNPFKPYLKELRTPGGVNLLVDSPADHIHHHGAMFGVSVDGVDFWGEADAARVGAQTPRSTRESGGEGAHGLVQDLAWRGPDGRRLLLEERRLQLFQDRHGPTLLSWESRLALPRGGQPRLLTGAHYVGLGLRLHPDFNAACRFLTSEGRAGVVVRGDERLTFARWCAAEGEVGGRPVTLALMDHPDNPRASARFFTMAAPFAYLSATLNLHEQPRRITAESPLTARYAVAAWDGHPGLEEIERACADWLAGEARRAGLVNVARPEMGASAYASSEYGPGYAAGNVMDGRWASRESDKWNSKENQTPHYLRIDLGQAHSIERIVVRHEGAIPVVGGHVYNSSDFRLQAAPGAWGPWTDLIAPVRGNSDNVTAHDFAPTPARYVRLLLETSEQKGGNAYGRIAELEIYTRR